MKNPRLFWGTFVFVGVLVISCITYISYAKNTVFPEDCNYGVMSCIEVKKHWYDEEIKYRDCDKVYCRKSPLVEEKWNNLPYDVYTDETNETPLEP